MKQKMNVELLLPVEGIYSEAGASRVQCAILRLPGVSRIDVDQAAGRINVSYDPIQVDLVDLQYALDECGCIIPTIELTLSIEGMHCLSCISHVQGALKSLSGVVDASASLSDRIAQVRYVPGLVSLSQMVETVNRAGYSAAPHPASSPMNPETKSRSSTAIRFNRWLYWLSQRWIVAISLILGFYVVFPFLAPVLMAVGAEAPAKIIYKIFSFLCHQFPQRSFFLFGQQFMYPLSQFTETIGREAVTLITLRQFIGNPEIGWKVAWSDRMVSMFSSTLIFAWIWYPLRSFLRRLSWQAMVLLLMPMAVDGFTHLISDLSGIGQGFRETNTWLAVITNHAFPPSFYAGDALGSFNSLMRLLTGLLFGLAAVWFGFPYLDEFFSEIKTHIQIKFQRAGLRL